MTLRTRVSRLEARCGASTNKTFHLDELSDDELNILMIYVCQSTLDNPESGPLERANAEAELPARQPLPVIDGEQVAAMLERVATPQGRINLGL